MLVALAAILSSDHRGHAQSTCDFLDVEVTTTPALEQMSDMLHSAFERMDAIPRQADVVLIGDSIISRWPAGQANAAFPGETVFNFGVSGDRTQNVLWRLDNSSIWRLHPNKVVLVIGTNNLSYHDKACSVSAGIDAIIDKIDSMWGHPTIYTFGVLPRGPVFEEYSDSRREIYASLTIKAASAKNLVLNNIDSDFSCHSDRNCANFISDHLHPSVIGYDFLGRALQNLK